IPPTLPAWSPGTNPAGVASNYTVSGTVNLPGGSYWFNSLTINGNLSFSGPATIYLNGPLSLVGSLAPGDNIPADLTLYGYGAQGLTVGDGGANNCTLCAQVYAPTCDFVVKNAMNCYGRGFFSTIALKNTASFYYDEGFGAAIGGKVISLAK